MTLPASIQIAGQRIKVILTDDLEDCYGCFCFEIKAIKLRRDLKGKLRLETLRHEMMEAALLLSGVGWGEKYDQEQIVRCMDEVFWPAWEKLTKSLAMKARAKSPKG